MSNVDLTKNWEHESVGPENVNSNLFDFTTIVFTYLEYKHIVVTFTLT